MPAPLLSVVIPTRDRPELLDRCLTALVADTGPDTEVLVVDSASTRAAEVAAVAARHGVQLLRCEVKGTSRARNAGWRAAAAPEVAFVDDDVFVLPGWSAALRGRTDERVAYTAGRTVVQEGWDGPSVSVTQGRPPDVLDGRDPDLMPPSNNLLFRRDVLAQTGGFDERLGPGTALAAGEDLELLDRVHALGYLGRYAHDAVAVHEQHRDVAALRRLHWAYGKGMGARCAAAMRRKPSAGFAQLPGLLRLGGIVTLFKRLKPGRGGAATDTPVQAGDAHGLIEVVLWRLGGVYGLLRGLVVLSRRGR